MHEKIINQTDRKSNLKNKKEFNFSQPILIILLIILHRLLIVTNHLILQIRIEENSIEELLTIDHLNADEKHVEGPIKKLADRFYIPGELLAATTVLQHNIQTTYDQPIFSKQYRFLPIHKEEISRQVNELINTIENILKNWVDQMGYCKASRGSHLNDVVLHF